MVEKDGNGRKMITDARGIAPEDIGLDRVTARLVSTFVAETEATMAKWRAAVAADKAASSAVAAETDAASPDDADIEAPIDRSPAARALRRDALRDAVDTLCDAADLGSKISKVRHPSLAAARATPAFDKALADTQTVSSSARKQRASMAALLLRGLAPVWGSLAVAAGCSLLTAAFEPTMASIISDALGHAGDGNDAAADRLANSLLKIAVCTMFIPLAHHVKESCKRRATSTYLTDLRRRVFESMMHQVSPPRPPLFLKTFEHLWLAPRSPSLFSPSPLYLMFPPPLHRLIATHLRPGQ